ncbi:helix-turn-helix domain-containing protein [Phytohabitans rumicis]|uniref:Uncharacterized protein n=1 Tax=Phytohabitans rumicis TaxID=1076125 RepID=A0A6V8KYM4_9ACTN|nr:helix-turn-helix domain-containing protein [Phytohabitans rumicis]GFJ88480.1 hypothetical protein Prum_021220 [Phytohabitans rumicis]
MPDDQVSRQVTRLLRAHLDELVERISQEIQAAVPQYARPRDETYARTVQRGVEHAVLHFADLLDRRTDADQGWREAYRTIGAGEVREGRSLDALHAAIRTGARAGWQWLAATAERDGLAPDAIVPVAEAIFAYLDDLVDASASGYAHAQAAEVGELDRRRQRLVDLLVAEPPHSAAALTAAALAARWPLPRRLAVVAVDAPAGMTTSPVLSPEMLSGLHRVDRCLVVPEPKAAAQVRALVNTLARYHAAVGPPVAVADAAKSLRWARRALRLARRGVIRADGVVWCAEHLATLAVFQDEDLLTALAERRLAPLATLRDGQRTPLTETLLAWLQNNMNANAVAIQLHVHPQTVRHRLRVLRRLFGDQIRDPDLRFELEIALRAGHRW